jgi:hypothetical protein
MFITTNFECSFNRTFYLTYKLRLENVFLLDQFCITRILLFIFL